MKNLDPVKPGPWKTWETVRLSNKLDKFQKIFSIRNEKL